MNEDYQKDHFHFGLFLVFSMFYEGLKIVTGRKKGDSNSKNQNISLST